MTEFIGVLLCFDEKNCALFLRQKCKKARKTKKNFEKILPRRHPHRVCIHNSVNFRKKSLNDLLFNFILGHCGGPKAFLLISDIRPYLQAGMPCEMLDRKSTLYKLC